MAAAGGRGITISFDEAAMTALLESEQGPVGRLLQRVGEVVAQGAKRRAPVSADGSNGRPSGYLRNEIGWEIMSDGGALLVRVATPATTPDGHPYGLFQEIGTSKMEAQPHLRPAVDDVRGMSVTG